MNSKYAIQDRFNVGSKIMIVVIGVYLFLMTSIVQPQLYGEGSNYLMTTVALENRMSMFFTESDYKKAKIDFPDVYPIIKWRQDNGIHIGCKVNLRNGEEVEHGWYFGTYSLSCIPIKYVLKLLHLPQSYCFQITNAIFYLLALSVVYKKLRLSPKNKFVLILLLSFSPGIFHMVWASAEVFIFSCIVIALVYWHNKSYKIACLMSALASTMNPTSGVLLFAILLDYLIGLYKELKKDHTVGAIKHSIIDLTKIFFICIISIVPPIYNYILFGRIYMMTNYGSFKDYHYRFFSYLFDLNFGFLPYFFIVFIAFIVLICMGVFKKNLKSMMYFIAFFGTVGAYSVMYHINCGITAIHRYNSWSFVIFIFYVMTEGYKLLSEKILNKFFYKAMYCSAVITTVTTLTYGGVLAANKISPCDHTPIAKVVLDHVPALYNPYHFTFVCRTNHEDGAYHYEIPVIYSNSKGSIRKILVTPSTAKMLDSMVVGDDKSMNYLKDRISEISNKQGKFYYVNVSSQYKLTLRTQ